MGRDGIVNFFLKKGYQKKDIPFFCRINLLETFFCNYFLILETKETKQVDL